MKKIGLFCFYLSLLIASSLYAEVELVTIRWRPQLCQFSCVIGLEEQFQRLYGAAEVHMSPQAGQASIIWKPHVPFVYNDIHMAMAAIGLHIEDIRLRVRGTIIIAGGDTFKIRSLGDNTVLDLLGTVNVSPGGYTMQNSPETHRMSPELKARLAQAQARRDVVMIEGPLFEPWRYPQIPFYLIAERVKIEPPKQQ